MPTTAVFWSNRESGAEMRLCGDDEFDWWSKSMDATLLVAPDKSHEAHILILAPPTIRFSHVTVICFGKCRV